MKPVLSIPATQRIESIDLLRGIVIVIMALDHIRDYFHADAYLFNPTDLSQTSPAIFFTRWITHFCAPVFVFLAGTSAYQIGIKKGKVALSSFLIKRGLWLILLEFTVINFAWFFNVTFSFEALTVIWALGIGMIVLAGLVHLPFKVILIFGAILILGHNALDGIHFDGAGGKSFLWAIIHDQRAFFWGTDNILFVGYGLVPWVGVMALGYSFGSLYVAGYDVVKRKNLLLQLGTASIVVFVLLRLSNVYGDPHPWETQQSAIYTILSFFNLNKYPPSLLYLLMTLGPALLVLALTEHVSGKISRFFLTFGRVPMFFYIIHIYLVHAIALVAAIATGFPASSMVFHTWVTDSPDLKGYGFSLGFTYVVWLLVISMLFPLCKAYEKYKRDNRDKAWLSYL